VPYGRKIADVDLQIAELLAVLSEKRGYAKDKGEQDKLLAQLARLKAERTRLMLRQRVHEQSQP
jgi:hypothetical protein